VGGKSEKPLEREKGIRRNYINRGGKASKTLQLSSSQANNLFYNTRKKTMNYNSSELKKGLQNPGGNRVT